MFILITFMHDTNIFFFVTNHTPSGKKNSGDLNAGEKPTLFCLAITNLIPTFVFAFPTNPCLHLMLHHYTPYPFFPTLPSAIFKQNNPSIILPTFRYTILHPLSTMLRSVIWYTSQLCNCKPSYYNFTHFLPHQTTLTLYFQLHYAIHYIPQLSLSICTPTSISWPACCYVICYNTILPSGNTIHLLNFSYISLFCLASYFHICCVYLSFVDWYL